MKVLALCDLGVVADDLTGACDVAACFARLTGPWTVHVSLEGVLGGGAVLGVLNTQSRLMPAEESKALLRLAGRELRDKPVVYKKIDSALRGPVGAEIEGLLDGLGPRKTILAPALPRLGKITRGGVQYDGGIRIDQTEYAGDVASPVCSADIREVIEETGNVECEIPDAETDDDLRRIVREALDGPSVLFVGSLGLADALAQQVAGPCAEKKGVRPAQRPMIACGSLYERAQAQLETAVSIGQAVVVDVREAEMSDITWDWPPEGTALILRFVHEWAEGSPRPMISEVARRFTARVVELLGRLKPDGLGVVGGETAFHLFRGLQAGRLEVHGRMSDVIAYGVIGDGLLAGCPFTSKGGSVGPDDSVVKMIEYLRSGEGSP